MVSTHRATWGTRVGLVGVLTAGVLAFVAGPALAAPDGIEVKVEPGSVSVTAGGGAQPLRVTIRNARSTNLIPTTPTPPGPAKGDLRITLPVQVSGVGVVYATKPPNANCDISGAVMTCKDVSVADGDTQDFDFSIGAAESSLQPGQTAEGTGSATFAGKSGGFSVKLTAGAAKAGITSISGRVLDIPGTAVEGATVKMIDTAGKQRTATTDAQGEYTDTPTDAATQLKPGNITFTVTKAGFTSKPVTKVGVAGQPMVNIDLKVTASASASPTPTPSTNPTPIASQSGGMSQGPSAAPIAKPESGGMGLMSWLLIGLGVLLVGGAGLLIFLVLRKGKDPEDDGEPSTPTPSVYGGGANRMPPGDDAPTMMHNGPLVTDDEYGYPQPAETQQYGGADATRQYGSQQGYGQRTDQYGAPADPYAAPPAVDPYRQQQQPAPASDPYGQQTQHYTQPADPYVDYRSQDQGTRQMPAADDRRPQPPQHQQPAPPPQDQPRQPDRRPLDWLDD